MTLDATLPSDTTTVASGYAGIMRETRAQVNTNIASIGALGAVTTVSTVTINGQTTLTTGTDVTAVPLELVIITAVGSETLNNILDGTEGQIKIFWLLGGSLTFADDDTKLSNNGDANFAAATGDVIAYVNKNGGGGTTDGYWHELFRTVRT